MVLAAAPDGSRPEHEKGASPPPPPGGLEFKIASVPRGDVEKALASFGVARETAKDVAKTLDGMKIAVAGDAKTPWRFFIDSSVLYAYFLATVGTTFGKGTITDKDDLPTIHAVLAIARALEQTLKPAYPIEGTVGGLETVRTPPVRLPQVRLFQDNEERFGKQPRPDVSRASH